MRIIEEQEAREESKKPFFLYLPFQAVHSPIQAPQRYVAPYQGLDPNRRVFGGMLAALDEAVKRVKVSTG